MHILVTAGPTREYLDPVRFLSNPSTGKMGYACAAAAVQSGHRVTLVSGPVAIEPPKGVKLVRVTSAAEMAVAVKTAYERCDAVIMTAAVCDYRPCRIQAAKMAKTGGNLSLELERTEDILAGLGATKQKQVLIGFAVQDRDARRKARNKLTSKNLDAIVLNSPAAFAADRTEAHILRRGQRYWDSLSGVSKAALARRLIRLAEELVAGE